MGLTSLLENRHYRIGWRCELRQISLFCYSWSFLISRMASAEDVYVTVIIKLKNEPEPIPKITGS